MLDVKHGGGSCGGDKQQLLFPTALAAPVESIFRSTLRLPCALHGPRNPVFFSLKPWRFGASLLSASFDVWVRSCDGGK